MMYDIIIVWNIVNVIKAQEQISLQLEISASAVFQEFHVFRESNGYDCELHYMCSGEGS